MTSSKFRGFQTPSPPSSSVIFAIPPPDDVIFYQPRPAFPKMTFGNNKKIMVKFKITKFSFEYHSKQKSIHLLLTECFRHEMTHFD